MKTTMIKSAILSLATVGLASNLQAQSVGFGLSFNSAGLNSIGFSYGGGNFGVGLGFSTYGSSYYPYYPYCGTYYSWPTYSTYYWGPTWGYPCYSWYYPSCYYPGWYGYAHPYYYGCSSYYGYYNGCYPHYSGYYYAQPHTAVAYNGAYAHNGGAGYGSLNHNAPVTARPPTGIAAPISRAPVQAARPVAGTAPYHRVFSSASWDQPRPTTQIPASNPGMISSRSIASNPSIGLTRAPGSQRVFNQPTFSANSPARPTGTFTGPQPARPVAWNSTGNHTSGSGPTAAPRPMNPSAGMTTSHYTPAWYRPEANTPRTPTSPGSFTSRPAAPAPIHSAQAFGGAPRSATGHSAQPAGFRPSSSVARAVPATHGGFTGGQMAQAHPVGAMGGGHSFGGFRH